MDFKKYFSPIFASVTFFNFVFIDNVKANLKESFQKRSICSAENAEFEKINKSTRYEMDNKITEYYIHRYCITGDNRIIQYSKKEKDARFFEFSKTGFLGKKESSYSPINSLGAYQSTWYSMQWEIEDDQLILYSCSSVTSTDCGANVKRSVKAYKIGTLKHKNNSKIRLGYVTGKYTGDYKDGKQTGKGTYVFDNGDKYTGDFKDGKRHGKGTYFFKNGDKYTGDYKDGKRHGKGTFEFHYGDKYTGEYLDGKQSGKGIYIWNNGQKYVGDFQNDEITGYGKLIYPNGKIIEGKWLKGTKL